MELQLLIHGFAGSTAEIVYVQRYLAAKGLHTHMVKLAGHGGGKRDLHRTGYKDWLQSAEAELAPLMAQYNRINIIGFSMGGLVAAYLAEKYEIDRLVLINTPVYFWNLKVIAKGICRDILGGGRENISYYWKNIGRVSLKSCLDFLRILRQSKKRWKDVKIPCLILQCKEDEAVHYKSARYILGVGKEKTVLRLYKGGCHQVFLKAPDLRDTFCEEIYRFLYSE